MFKESDVLKFDMYYELDNIELMLHDFNTLLKIHNIYEHIDNTIDKYLAVTRYRTPNDYSNFKSKIVVLLNMYLDLKIPISNMVEHHSKFLNEPTILSLMKEGE